MSDGASPVVGVVGLGAMGLGMASTLAAKGFRVFGFDLSAERRTKAGEAGVEPVETLDAVFGGTSHLVFSLPTAADVSSVLEPRIGRLGAERRVVVIDTSTSEPEVSRALARRLDQAGDLARLIERTQFAISTEETRYYLNGVYMHVAQVDGQPMLRCVATDGHRLARIDAPLPVGADEMPGVIVPRKTVAELRKLLDDDDTDIAVSVSETKVRFATPTLTLTSKVIDGTFPDYSRVIPLNNSRKLEVDATDFARAVDRVATVSSERSRAVKLALDQDRLILSVNAPDAGAAEEELIVAYADDPLEIGFNAKYLQEIASQVDRDNAVFMFNGSGDAALIREGGDQSAVYVVMPMRV